ncbi:long-chain-acyl-CoA synthetase domain protein, partial [Cooperia oncophora]
LISLPGIGSVIVFGTTAVIRKKFSASNFWRDCVKYNCTASQYIGEICRYLLAQKPCEEEKKHRVRLMWGNGLRAEIWTEFVTRFGIQRIGELYGSTEGNSNIVNIDNHVGSCGFFPIYPHIGGLYPVRLIKVDQETGELIRDAKGLCVPCRPGELGEMVGVIKKDLLLKFEGYVDKGDTEKKIYRDVFAHGDQVFASGDILYWDKLGYLYFKDRRGDTFR